MFATLNGEARLPANHHENNPTSRPLFLLDRANTDRLIAQARVSRTSQISQSDFRARGQSCYTGCHSNETNESREKRAIFKPALLSNSARHRRLCAPLPVRSISPVHLVTLCIISRRDLVRPVSTAREEPFEVSAKRDARGERVL